MTTLKSPEQAKGLKSRDLLLSLIAMAEGRQELGRTSIQKVAYFASLALNRDLGHKAHFYGPFSEIVEDELEALVLSDLIDEKVTTIGVSSGTGFPVRKYEYSITDEGSTRVKEIAEVHPQDTAQLDNLMELILEHAGGLDQRVLSPAAKVLYIAGQQDRAVRSDEIQLAGADLGWDLDESQVKLVAELLERLGFVKLS